MFARNFLVQFVVCFLLICSAQLAFSKSIGGYPLVSAIEKGQYQKVEEFIAAKKTENNGVIGDVGEVVMEAVISDGYNEVLTSFLKAGYDPNSRIDKESPIHLAAKNNNLQAIKILLEYGAYINVEDADGNTALYYSNQVGNEEITRYLLQQGIKPSAPFRRPNYPEDIGKEHLPALDDMQKVTTSDSYPVEDLNSPEFLNSERLQFMYRGKFDAEETVWSSKLDGSDLRQVVSEELLYKDQKESGDPHIAGVFRSPNRRYLLVFSSATNNNMQIKLIDLEAKTSRRVITTRFERDNIKAIWEPDSRQVSFAVYYNSASKKRLLRYDLGSNSITSFIDPKYFADAYDSKTKTHYVIKKEFLEQITNNGESKKEIIGDWANCCSWDKSRSVINLKNNRLLLQGYKRSIISSISNNKLNIIYKDKIRRQNPVFSADGNKIYYHDFDSLKVFSVSDKTTKTIITPIGNYDKIFNLTLLPKVDSVADTATVNSLINDNSLHILDDGILYKGALENGKPDGIGKWQYQLATKWEGEKHKDIKNRITAYDGSFNKGKFNGHGKALWLEGESYEGEWKNGMRHGKGTYISLDSSKSYIGNWVEDKKHGSGQCGNDEKYFCDFHHGENLEYVGKRSADGKKHGVGTGKWDWNEYSGQWTNDEVTGFGEMKDSRSKIYKGNFTKGKLNGHGEYKYYSSSYVGDFKDSEFHGHGKAIWDGERSYTGQWKNGKRWGKGKYTFKARDKSFDGNWVDDEKHGSGMCGDAEKYLCDFYHGEALEYSGERSADGKKHGIGTGKWDDNEYTGQWTNGEITGEGTLNDSGYYSKGVYSGTFINGKLNGKGEFTKSGISYVGEWKDGLYHGEGELTRWKRSYKGQFKKGEYIWPNIIDRQKDKIME